MRRTDKRTVIFYNQCCWQKRYGYLWDRYVNLVILKELGYVNWKQGIQSKTCELSSILEAHNKAKIVDHISKFQKHGFAIIKYFVQWVGRKIKLPHKFNRVSHKAGYLWLHFFLRRNWELNNKSEGVSHHTNGFMRNRWCEC